MTEIAPTVTSRPLAGRSWMATLALGAAVVAIVAAAVSLRGPEVSAPPHADAGPVTETAAYAGELNSEYLLRMSRAWEPVPMTQGHQRLLNELHSEYLIELGHEFRTPMTREQAQLRGELHSEYLRDLALGW